jgi:hypothetical protein
MAERGLMVASKVLVLFEFSLLPPYKLDDSIGEESWLASTLRPSDPGARADLGMLRFDAAGI